MGCLGPSPRLFGRERDGGPSSEPVSREAERVRGRTTARARRRNSAHRSRAVDRTGSLSDRSVHARDRWEARHEPRQCARSRGALTTPSDAAQSHKWHCWALDRDLRSVQLSRPPSRSRARGSPAPLLASARARGNRGSEAGGCPGRIRGSVTPWDAARSGAWGNVARPSLFGFDRAPPRPLSSVCAARGRDDPRFPRVTGLRAGTPCLQSGGLRP